MNDITKRQAYVFLDTSDASEETGERGDQFLEGNMNHWSDLPEDAFVNGYRCVRRPVDRADTQHTVCAVCGIDKPTPLRDDDMGGYVCLTCVCKEMDSLRSRIVEKDMMIGRMAERLECLDEAEASLGPVKQITKEEWRNEFK